MPPIIYMSPRQGYDLTNLCSGVSLRYQHNWRVNKRRGVVRLPQYSFDSFEEYQTALELCRPDFRRRAVEIGIEIAFSQDDVVRLWRGK